MEDASKFYLPLGKAIAVVTSQRRKEEWKEFSVSSSFSSSSLLHSPKKDVEDCNSLRFALKSIEFELKKEESCKEIVEIFIDKILLPPLSPSLLSFFQWLSFIQGSKLVEKMNEMLLSFSSVENPQKKKMLGILLILPLLFHLHSSFLTSSPSSSPFMMKKEVIERMEETAEEKKQEKISLLSAYFALCPSLLFIAEEYSIKEGLRKKGTRLVVSSSDFFFSFLSSISSFISDSFPSSLPLPSSPYFILLQNLEEKVGTMIQFLEELIYWNKEKRRLFTTGIIQVKEKLKRIERIVSRKEKEEKENYESAIHYLLFICTCYFPLLQEQNEEREKRKDEQVNEMLKSLEDPTNPNFLQLDLNDQQIRQESNANYLICIFLILGILKEKEFAKTISTFSSTFYSLLPRFFSSSHSLSQSLAIELFQSILSLSLSSQNIQSVIYPLFQLLLSPSSASPKSNGQKRRNAEEKKERERMEAGREGEGEEEGGEEEGGKKGTVGIIGELSVKYPNEVLPIVFEWIDSNSFIQKKYALLILNEITRISKDFQSENQILSQKLAFHLLNRLTDNYLPFRRSSARLFSTLPPSLTIPTLIYNCCIRREGRVSSASEEALMEILNGHRNIPESIQILLDSIRKGPSFFSSHFKDTFLPSKKVEWNPSSLSIIEGKRSEVEEKEKIGIEIKDPSMIFSNYQPKVSEEDLKEFCERVFRRIEEWGKSLPSFVWKELIPALTSKFFADAEDSVVLSFLSKLSSSLGNQIHLLFPILIEKMENQWKPSLPLLKDSEQSKSLLFDRIRPLLLCRLLPISSFSSPQLSSSSILQFISLLMERIQFQLEFPQVKKISIEILSRFSPFFTAKTIIENLQISFKEKHLENCKIWLFGFWNLLMNWGIHPLSSVSSVPFSNEKGREKEWILDFFVFDLAPSLIEILEISKEEEKKWKGNEIEMEMSKLQMGTVDCLSFLIVIHLSLYKESNVSPLFLLIHKMKEIAKVKPSREESKRFILLTNVLIQCCKFSPTPILKLLFSHIFIPISDFASSKLIQMDPLFQSSSLHLLFLFSFHLKSEIDQWKHELLEIGIIGMEEKREGEIRLNGLKLVGVLMTQPDNLFQDTSLFFKLETLLESISNLDPSQEARRLAEKYLAVIQSGKEMQFLKIS